MIMSPTCTIKGGNKYWTIDIGGGWATHREDGPAIEYTNGDNHWIQYSILLQHSTYHRLDGPAVDRANGHKEWWIDGLLHRLDGPAMEWADGRKQWYIKGVEISVSSQKEFEKYLKLIVFK